jgi:hypothetical protein
MDMATNASVLVEAAQPMGLLITNGEFTAFASPDWLDPSTIDQLQPMHVKVLPGNTGSVRFANSAFWGLANQTADVQGSGLVGFNGCIFNSWDGGGTGMYALVARGHSSLLVQGCGFQMACASKCNHVQL